MKIKNIGHSRKVRLLALLAHDNKKYQQIRQLQDASFLGLGFSEL